jgi:hypothetical protein
VKIPIQVEPRTGETAAVEYRWDPDTEILSAQIKPRASGEGMSGSVELEGADGSWLILDISDGRINGVEVAVWPQVHLRSGLTIPGTVEDGVVAVPARESEAAVASREVETAVFAESDSEERLFHFRLGKPRAMRTVRLANNLLLDIDSSNNLAGLWLLNVPPFQARV